MKRFYAILALALACFTMSAREFNFGSYNIRVFNKGDYKHNDGWEDRVDALCDLVSYCAFDVFGAQEVTHRQLEDMLDRLPEYSYVGVGRDDGRKGGEYSPVFYRTDRFKLLESGTFWLSETPDKVSKGWDGNCRRVCSYAHLKDKRTREEFWFFNTHMDHIGVIARREGAKLILSKIHEIAGEDANVVLSGDFNVDQNSEAYATIQSTGRLVDSYTIAEKKFSPGVTFNNFNVHVFADSRIDHIFVGKGTRVERYACLTVHYWKKDSINKDGHAEVHNPSDHYPLSVWVRFPKKK